MSNVFELLGMVAVGFIIATIIVWVIWITVAVKTLLKENE